ncbi:MAG: glucose 1-dehydrogenase [Nitrososphaerota archaeon]|nr:glucose 1-dehydrogenase [Nitrososphaerota archaeon]
MTPRSLAVADMPVPSPKENQILLEVLRVGVCGTDRDIVAGFYGESPEGSGLLILGHESLCRVASFGSDVTGFEKGDLVVPTVRRNCPENCLNCANGESDMCTTGHYKEHGIKQLNGFAAEYALSDSSFVVKLPDSLSHTGVLLEPLTIVEKGLIQTLHIQHARMRWEPKSALVLGAGPVGILATAILRLRGVNVDTVATRSKESEKARLIEATGGRYINAKETPLGSIKEDYDMVFELTGNPIVAAQAQGLINVNGILCYLGIYREEQEMENVGRQLTDTVLGNKVFFGSVNANKSYFVSGVSDLESMNKKWPGFLERMITKVCIPEDYQQAYGAEDEESIKTVIEFKSV